GAIEASSSSSCTANSATSPEARVVRHHATGPACRFDRWRASFVFPYPAGAARTETRAPPPSASRAISRGRSMMWSSAGEAAAVIVSTIPLPGQPTRDPRTLLLSQSLVTTAVSGGPALGVGPERGSPSAPGAGQSRRKLACEGVLAGERLERGRDLPPPRHAELLAKDVAVRLRRSRRDAETLSDLVVRAPARDQHNDLELALGEVGLCLVVSSHGPARYGRAAAPAIGRRGYSAGRRAFHPRSSPRGRVHWRLRAPLASARRFGAAGRTRRGGASASSPARPWRS